MNKITTESKIFIKALHKSLGNSDIHSETCVQLLLSLLFIYIAPFYDHQVSVDGA